MQQYLLNIYQPDGVAPAPELLEPVMRDVNALVQEAKDAGVWVFNGGLHPASTSTQSSGVRLRPISACTIAPTGAVSTR